MIMMHTSASYYIPKLCEKVVKLVELLLWVVAVTKLLKLGGGEQTIYNDNIDYAYFSSGKYDVL